MEEVILAAEERVLGKGSLLTKLKQEKRVPAVVYGDNKKNRHISVVNKEFLSVMHRETGLNTIITLKTGAQVDKVLVHEIQRDIISREIIHIDFYRIKLTKKITVKVPLRLLGKAIGQEEGGVVDHVVREIEVECLPTDIPPHFAVDITRLGIGDSIILKEIAIPDKVTLVSDPEAIVVHVVTADKEEPKPEPVAEEGAVEPEVIAKGKEKAEGKEGEAPAKEAPKEAAKPKEDKEKK